MIPHAANPKASESPVETKAVTEKGTEVFQGFEPLKSNYVYCPNQFFDICLKSKSRGMVRIVAYIIRQTLGWLDENGQPINETVKVSYRDLIQKAGVSRGAIGKALQQAVACGFLECCIDGQANQKGQRSQTAEYTLRWDTNPQYMKTFADFSGFYAGEGNRTPIPNSFFDWVIPNEPLAVTKVVGTVIRHTVGFETRYGGRRSTHPMSCSFIQRYTLLSNRRKLIEAIHHAVNVGYILKVKAGVFSHRPSEQEATTYGIRWLTEKQNSDSGSKRTPVFGGQFKKVTSNSSKSSPAERFKKDTSIEKTKQKDILKQQAAANFELEIKQKLVAEGFDLQTTAQLIEASGITVVESQLKWLDARKPDNRAAMLRKAIVEDWAEPASFQAKAKIAEARKRDSMKAVVKRSEEGIASERKRLRQERKHRLLAVWNTASNAIRESWIESAVARESSAAIRKILAKQNPSNTNPHVQVLDEIAFERGLEPVTQGRLTRLPSPVAEHPSQSEFAHSSASQNQTQATPQTEKMPTELASFSCLQSDR